MRSSKPYVFASTILGVFFAGFVSGCGIPAPPLPPSLNLPRVVENLQAQRTADSVLLEWTAPTQNTDKTAIKAGGEVDVCRRTAGDAMCGIVGHAPWIPGATVEFVDLLPAELRAGPARELFYEVAVKNAKGRSAGWSERASALAGASAPAVSDLNALNSAAGVELRWKVTDPAEEGTLYRIRRELLPHSQAEDNAQAARHRGRTEGQAAEQTLEVKAGAAEGTAALDSHVMWGERYRYQVQAVRKVEVPSQGGVKTLEMRGTGSNFAEVTTTNIFPPAAPQGLAAIPVWVKTAGTGNANGAGAPGMDLNWEPNTEPTVEGYRVYRISKLAGRGLEQRALVSGDGLLSAPAFEDRGLEPGADYYYSVVAVDSSGNVSREARTGVITALASGN